MTFEAGATQVRGVERSDIVESFLSMSPNLVLKTMERDPNRFDELRKEKSVEVLRKLSEAIKFLNDTKHTEIADRLVEIKKAIYETIESKKVPTALEHFTEEERIAIMSNSRAYELTKGCSVACTFCAFSAEKKVQGSVPFEELVYMVRHYAPQLPKNPKDFLPYWASDPLDYQSGDKDIRDVIELFQTYMGSPYISTAYPKNKKALFSDLMEKGYIDRVSVSMMNLKRLTDGGWLTEKDGVITSKYDAIHKGLQEIYSKENNAGDEQTYEIRPKDVVAGYAYKSGVEGGSEVVGGISCQLGPLLRVDGFYNMAVCHPTDKDPKGFVATKTGHETISKQIDPDNLPKTVNELLEFGIVEYQDTYPSNFQYLVLNNFSGGKRSDYFAEYNSRTLEIVNCFPFTDRERLMMNAYINSRRGEASVKEEKIEELSLKILRTIPDDIDLNSLDKSNVFYKELVKANRFIIEDLLTTPSFDFEQHTNFMPSNFGESSEDSAWDREWLTELVMVYKNSFTIARDAQLDKIQSIDEAEKNFMDRLYNALLEALQKNRYRRNGTDGQQASIIYLKNVFGKS